MASRDYYFASRSTARRETAGGKCGWIFGEIIVIASSVLFFTALVRTCIRFPEVFAFRRLDDTGAILIL